jgi:uncharacterized protein YjhX (UPF0386 family)
MRIFIYLFIYLFSLQNQEKKVISVLFDIKSKKEFIYERKTIKFFEKLKQKRGVQYRIGDEYFFVKKGNNGIAFSSIKDVKLSDFEDIKKDIETDTVWGFKSDIYEKVYLYEKICDDKYIKYEAVLLYFEI